MTKSIEQAFTNSAIREQIIERGNIMRKLASNIKQGHHRNITSRLGATTTANLSSSLWDFNYRNPKISTKLHLFD